MRPSPIQLKDLHDKYTVIKWIQDVKSMINLVDAKISDLHIEKLSDENLTELIKSLIPEVKDGYTPTENDILEIVAPLVDERLSDENLTELIKPLIKIPEVKDGETPSDEKLLGMIQPLIPNIEVPQRGVHYFTPEDVAHIVKKVRKEIGEQISIEEVISQLKEKKLSTEHIDGFEQTISSLFDQLRTRHGSGYVHGGGDTIAAGSNITLTRNPNGTTTVASTGGGSLAGSQEKSTTTPDGVAQTFTFTHTPLLIYWNGQLQTLTDDYTVSGLTITFTGTLAPSSTAKIVNVYA